MPSGKSADLRLLWQVRRIPQRDRAADAPIPPELASAAPGSVIVGERRHLTVLFCDLVNSTEIAAHLDPEEWRDIAAQYQRSAGEAVMRLGGHVAKYLGDGLVVYFGYPQAHEDDAERAVRGGLAIVDAIAPLNDRLAGEHSVMKLAVRVGIHTGSVVVGQGGGKEADVFGDAPNIASRVQAVAEPDTVVITAPVHQLVSGLFVVEDRGAHALKGIELPVQLYRAIQPSVVRRRTHGSARALTPFVGRDDEMRLLLSRWERACEGEGQLVVVAGEAGIGKSRLVEEFRARIKPYPHLWIECAGEQFFENTPFHAVTQMLNQGLGWRGDESNEERIIQVERSLELSGVKLGETVPLIAEMLNLPIPEKYPPLMFAPDQKRRRLLAALAGWVFGATRMQPLVLTLEDLHWVDPSTLELQHTLVEQAATVRLMLLFTARPEFRAPWLMRAHHAQVTLNRLNDRQTREMVAGVAARSVLAKEVIDTVVKRADGVPLFAEELTRLILEGDGRLVAREIPATLHDSLTARLDQLGEAREVAQVAAVIGREFSYELLQAVLPIPEAELQSALAKLADAELIYARGIPPEATYQFKHALIQDAAYEALLKSKRRQLHGRVVEVLLAQFPGRAAAQPEVMARHAELAGQTDEAIMYYQRAGEQAQARSAHGEAIAQFRKAIALLATQSEGAQRDTHEVALQLLLGGSLIAERGFAHPEVEAPYERARILCEAVGDAGRLAIAQLGLANFYYNRGDVERGRALATEVLALAESQGSAELLVMAHQNVAEPEFYQGKFASSLTHCERALTLYDPARHSEFLPAGSHTGIPALGYAAWNLWNLGWPDSALARAEEAVALGRRLNHPFSLVRALFFETAIHRFRRDRVRQHERAAEVVALSEIQNFPLFLGMGRYWMVAGDLTGLSESLEALTLIRETGYQSPGIITVLAETQQAAGQLAEAQATVAVALAISAQLGQPFGDADLQRLDGDLILSTGGAPEEAAARYQRALDIARAQEAKSFELRAATSLARLWHDQGKRAAARDLLAPLYAWFTEGFDTADLKDAKAVLDELCS